MSKQRKPSKAAKQQPTKPRPESQRPKAQAIDPKPPAAPLPKVQPARAEQAQPDLQDVFRRLVDLANRGDREAVQRLRLVLDHNPTIWQQAGDAAAMAENAWIELTAAGNRLVAESLRRSLKELKAGLAGPHPTELEELLVAQTAVTWLAAQDAEMRAASVGGSLGQAAFHLKRAESSRKRFLNATKTLATLRALLPEGLAPLNRLNLHEPGRMLA